ncbi:rho GTPase-activating protein 20-like [Pollicipes pollicipes]|uniref:rho GTPase-activating protein 20-like n=1 Tax=Pollicipes pollicipes TaxID=41117 RepID=UPI0018850F78|nr:rho GTPase-activating protein 20-like [Pollicipes pollicipes]
MVATLCGALSHVLDWASWLWPLLVSTPGDGLSELERVQELFPSDDLGLLSRDASAQPMKGLIRKRSAPASRLQRALSAKAQRPSSVERSPARAAEERERSSPPEPGRRRQLVMESAVTFTAGLQSQDRHLFLFTDMLLVAKVRSGGNFKLKDKVRLSEMWLTSCLDEVADVARDPGTSLVMGWPTTNVVATFSGGPVRDAWLAQLTQLIAAERELEPKTTAIQLVYRDPISSVDLSQTLSVAPSTTARECVRSALAGLERPARSELRTLSPSPEPAKKKKMPKKSPIRIHRVFRRTNSKPDSGEVLGTISGAAPAPERSRHTS